MQKCSFTNARNLSKRAIKKRLHFILGFTTAARSLLDMVIGKQETLRRQLIDRPLTARFLQRQRSLWPLLSLEMVSVLKDHGQPNWILYGLSDTSGHMLLD